MTMTLRALEPSDLHLLFSLENDASLWAHSSTRAPYSRVALKQYIARAAQHDLYALRQLRLVAETEVRGVKQAVALVDLIDFSPEHHRAEVGIVVLPEHRNRGYAYEALQLLADYCRTSLSLHQLYAYVPVDNTPSQALFLKAGYRTLTTLDDWLYYAGSYRAVTLLTFSL